MFGFQRVGDFAWAAGDSQARGFPIGATSGEQLWLEKVYNIKMAIVIYYHQQFLIVYQGDPTFAYELASYI